MVVHGCVLLSLGLVISAYGSSAPKSQSDTNRPSSGQTSSGLARTLPAKYRSGFSVAMEPSTPPETYVVNGQTTGISPDVMRAVAKVLGIPVHITLTSFENELLGVTSGRYTLAADTTISTAREQSYDQVGYYYVGSEFMYLKGKLTLGKSWSDLCGITIGDVVGSAGIPIEQSHSKACVAAKQKPITIVQEPSYGDLVLAVRSGHIEAFSVPTDYGRYVLSQPGGASLQLGGPGFSKYLVGASSEKGSAFMPFFIKALNVLIKNGTYQKILSKFGYDSTYQVTSASMNPTPTLAANR